MNNQILKSFKAETKDVIEQALVDNAETGWLLSTSRKIDARDYNKFIRVMASTGDRENSPYEGGSVNSAQVVISISSADHDDDELGDVGQLIFDAVMKHDFATPAAGIVSSGFEFPVEDADALEDLNLFFNLIYQ